MEIQQLYLEREYSTTHIDFFLATTSLSYFQLRQLESMFCWQCLSEFRSNTKCNLSCMVLTCWSTPLTTRKRNSRWVKKCLKKFSRTRIKALLVQGKIKDLKISKQNRLLWFLKKICKMRIKRVNTWLQSHHTLTKWL